MPKKAEYVRKRKDKRTQARNTKGYCPDGHALFGHCRGKPHRESKRKSTEAKASPICTNPVAAAADKKIFGSCCDEWLQMNRDRIRQSTYAKYSGMSEKYIKPKLGGYAVRELNSLLVEEFGHDLLTRERLSPKTVKDILTTLHSIVRYTSRQYPEQVPNIEIIYPKVPKKDTRVLNRDEQIRLVNYLLDDPDECKFGVLLALLTGMRIGEICALRWGNISLDERTIRVDATMQRLKNPEGDASAKTKVVISDPKSDCSARVIPLTEYAAKLCQAQYNSCPSAFVLTGEKDRFIEPRTMQYRLRKYTGECGLEGVHFHTLRHTFATRCVEVNFEIKSLSEILGHSSPQITLERYVHSSMELKRNNMNKLSAIGF